MDIKASTYISGLIYDRTIPGLRGEEFILSEDGESRRVPLAPGSEVTVTNYWDARVGVAMYIEPGAPEIDIKLNRGTGNFTPDGQFLVGDHLRFELTAERGYGHLSLSHDVERG